MSDNDEIERMKIDPHGVLQELRGLRTALNESIEWIEALTKGFPQGLSV